MRASLHVFVAMLVLVVFVAVPSGPARADLLEDFDGLVAGPLNGQGGWHADLSSAAVVRDHTQPGDQMLRLMGADADVYKSLGGLAVADGQTGTLFFRFRANSEALNHGIGVTEKSAPAAWGDYRATALMIAGTESFSMQGRNGNSGYVPLTLNGGSSDLQTGTWYDVWMVVNNQTDSADFYIQGGGIAAQRLVGQGLPFRNGSTSSAIQTFFSRVNSSGAGGSVLIDDIHVSVGVSLGVPAPAKSAPGAPDVDDLFSFAGAKLSATEAGLSAGAYPEKAAVGGTWSTTGASGWTSGFYPGALWQMYERTGEQAWRDAAEARTAGLEGQKTNTSTHDVGFILMSSFGQGYRLTGNESYRDVLRTGAASLAQRYDPTVGAIRSWGAIGDSDFRVIIDNMMNLELLFWAARNGGDSRLYDIALSHARTTLREHVRADGGTYHVVNFSRTTGEALDKYTSQGYADGSTWSRGQAWGLYGFTMAYRETREADMLAGAEALADYYVGHLPSDFVPLNDFDAPGGTPKDSSSAAIAASGLLELMNYVDEARAQLYFDTAERILLGLAGPDYLSDGTPLRSILTEGSVRYGGETGIGLIYGDYYFMEALARYDAVPEPATPALLAAGALAALRRRRRKKGSGPLKYFCGKS